MKQEILDYLNGLAVVQEKTDLVLSQKQKLLVHPDRDKLAAMFPDENEVIRLLQESLRRREEILAKARLKGMPGDSILSLCHALFPKGSKERRLAEILQQRTQSIRFQALANWTMTQKSIIHLSQILEMIETRGQGKTTYKPQRNPDVGSSGGGGFVDRVA